MWHFSFCKHSTEVNQFKKIQNQTAFLFTTNWQEIIILLYKHSSTCIDTCGQQMHNKWNHIIQIRHTCNPNWKQWGNSFLLLQAPRCKDMACICLSVKQAKTIVPCSSVCPRRALPTNPKSVSIRKISNATDDMDKEKILVNMIATEWMSYWGMYYSQIPRFSRNLHDTWKSTPKVQ